MRIHHIFQRFSLSILARPFWQDVEERAAAAVVPARDRSDEHLANTLAGSLHFAKASAPAGLHLDILAAREPLRSSAWIDATSDAVRERQTMVETLSDQLMAIAADGHAFKAHFAQPKLNSGQSDLNGWVYINQHALHIFGVCQQQLAAAATDVEQGRSSLMAMRCPLPPSVSTAYETDSQFETNSTGSAADSHNVHDAYSDANSLSTLTSGDTPRSLGARSVPLRSGGGGAQPPGHRYRYGYGNDGAHEDVLSRIPRPRPRPRADPPPPLAALRDRQRLEHRIADWISKVPSKQVTSYVVGDLSHFG